MEKSMPEIIRKKRDGLELTSEEIQYFTQSVVSRSINESQTGAMLMAMFLKNLSFREVLDLTKSFINTGEVLNFENIGKDILVDKHSTGGVGDKISLILAPALAACGLKIPMISGRSLGYTGGTLDKLESIPGFQVNLNIEQMNNCLSKAGCFICGATKTIAPADAVLYQIRDITSTADSLSLIVPSILSKKAAEGIGTLVIDVKHGNGSFFKTEMEAQEAGQLMIKIGRSVGLNVRAILSEMNVPLGRYVGNSLEVVESVMCLKNQVNNSVVELVTTLGGLVLEATGLANTFEEGKVMIQNTLANQRALKSFEKMLISQGVSEKNASQLCAGNFWNVLTKADQITVLRSSKTGFVVNIDALKIGKACWHLGGGRTGESNEINYSVGVVLLKSVGDEIRENEPWVEVHHSLDGFQEEVKNLISESLTVDLKPSVVEKKLKIVHVTEICCV